MINALSWPLCIPSRPPVIWIDKAQCTNFEYQTILSAYYQIHNSIMIKSCVFFPSRGLKQIVSFVSTPRKSRPPPGRRKIRSWFEGGQKFGLAKKWPEWICWGQEELLSRGYSHHSAAQNCLEISTNLFSTLLKATVLYALKSLCCWCFYPAIRLYTASAYICW